MNSKKKIFDIVSAEDLLNRLSLREALRICADVMTEDELAMLIAMPEQKAECKTEAIKQLSHHPRPAITYAHIGEPNDEVSVAQAITKEFAYQKRKEAIEKRIEELNKDGKCLVKMPEHIRYKPIKKTPAPAEEPVEDISLPDKEVQKPVEVKKELIRTKENSGHKAILALADELLYYDKEFTLQMVMDGEINGKKYTRSTASGAIREIQYKVDKSRKHSSMIWYKVKPEFLKKKPVEEVKPEPKPEVKPEPKPEVKPEIKPEPKPEVKEIPKPEVKPEVKEVPKPAPKPEIKVKEVVISKKPVVACQDLYHTPNLLDCVLKELYRRMMACEDPAMGQYDVKELLYKEYGAKLEEKYDLGPNQTHLMTAGHALMDYMATHTEYVRKNMNGTYVARHATIKQLARARGWK